MTGLYSAGIALIVGGGMLTGKGPAGALKPRPPAPPKIASMPDQNDVLNAQKLQESKDAAARFGRAATILTDNASTGDKLGP